VFRIRELLIRQRTQMINALRGHLGEFGQIVPQGAANAARLISIVEDPDSGLPADAAATLKVLVSALTHVETEISKLDAEIARRAKENDVARRLMTVPGTWLGEMLKRKPPMLVRVALANKMARIVWALMAKGGVYQSPAAAA
ncbi:MAG: IS110 family transposase, partial [Roseobacter sp.]|nr:IS110 family transposase [Roseobacter sp.]